MTATKTIKTPRTQNDWESWYKEKTGCEDLSPRPDEIVLYHPERGFVMFLTRDDVLELRHICGDGKYWLRLLKNVMKFETLITILGYTTRDPRAIARKYGGRVIGHEMGCSLSELENSRCLKANTKPYPPKTQSEWLEWYRGRGAPDDLGLSEAEKILYHPEHGFTTFLIYDGLLRINHMCGDVIYWLKVLTTIMREEKLTRASFFTKRNPKIWGRLCEARILGYEMEATINELKD